MRIVELPGSWRERAMVVSEVADCESWFSAGEMASVREFRLEKRRQEWMLSRIAERELRRRGGDGAHTSYSHSGPFGAAAVSASPVGIDVEVHRAIPPGAVHLFLSDDEAAAAARCAVPNALLHFWSAKEALWKQLGGAVPTLKRVPLRLVQEDAQGLRFDGVQTLFTESVVIALTV